MSRPRAVASESESAILPPDSEAEVSVRNKNSAHRSALEEQVNIVDEGTSTVTATHAPLLNNTTHPNAPSKLQRV